MIKDLTREEVKSLLSLPKALEDFIKSNSDEHQSIMEKQDHTNGDVTNLKLWKARIVGAITLLSFIITTGCIVLGVFWKNISQHETQDKQSYVTMEEVQNLLKK